MKKISNEEDVLDTRDILERIEELEREKDLPQNLALVDWYETDEGKELLILRKLIEECEEYSSEVSDGAALIRDTYFKDYCKELAEECGYITKIQVSDFPKKEIDNPLFNHINWDSWANDVRYDYSEVDFDGVPYWILNS